MQRSTFAFPDPILIEAVNRAAAEQRISRSELVRRILERELNVKSTYVPYQPSRSQANPV